MTNTKPKTSTQRKRDYVARQRAMGRKACTWWLDEEEKRMLDLYLQTLREAPGGVDTPI